MLLFECVHHGWIGDGGGSPGHGPVGRHAGSRVTLWVVARVAYFFVHQCLGRSFVVAESVALRGLLVPDLEASHGMG